MKKNHDHDIEVLDPAGIALHLEGIAGANEPMENLFINFFNHLDVLRGIVKKHQDKMLVELMSSTNAIVLHRETVIKDTLILEKYLHA